MDIRNSLDGLKSLLGVSAPAAGVTQTKSGPSATAGSLTSDSATVSHAGSQIALTAADSDVRPEKVAGIQAALASGTYNISASAVASKMVSAMLGTRQ
jgi:negative regulator of flagellin synthesis FlgM